MCVYVCLLPLKGRLCQCFIVASSFISFHVMSEEKEELYCCYCSWMLCVGLGENFPSTDCLDKCPFLLFAIHFNIHN